MKKTLFNILAIGLLGLSMASCDDAENKVIDNGIYISSASTGELEAVTIGSTVGEVTTINMPVRLAHQVSHDVTVDLKLDDAVLKAYNERTESAYELIPAQQISFPSQVVIPAGELVAEVPVKVTSFDGEPGVEYAAPLALVNAKGMEIASGSSKFIYAFSKPLVQPVPGFQHDNSMYHKWDSPVTLGDFTLEWWSRVTNSRGDDTGYTVNNQAIFSFEASAEIYIRFGDLVYAQGGQYMNNFLQIKFNGGQFDSGDPTKDLGLDPGKWYHFAFVYSCSEGKSTLYKNGVPAGQLTTSAGQQITINGLNMMSSGLTYFLDIVWMAQVRLWNCARTNAQIQGNMYRQVRFTDPQLVMYMPMNEGSGSLLQDVTGNNHGMEIGSKGGNKQALWSDWTFTPDGLNK